MKEPPPFRDGQRVAVQRGPFAELVGVIRELDADQRRALVSVPMLCKDHDLELGFVDMRAA